MSDSNSGREDQAAGKVKRAAGDLVGDEEMEREGQTQETKGDVKRKVEDVGDSLKGAAKGLTGRD